MSCARSIHNAALVLLLPVLPPPSAAAAPPIFSSKKRRVSRATWFTAACFRCADEIVMQVLPLTVTMFTKQ